MKFGELSFFFGMNISCTLVLESRNIIYRAIYCGNGLSFILLYIMHIPAGHISTVYCESGCLQSRMNI